MAEDGTPAAEPPVEGDAVELPFAVADEPIAVATSRPGPDPVAALADADAAAGHAEDPPPWQEPIAELARERPELVVGAAFTGGVLAAMILRRLGR